MRLKIEDEVETNEMRLTGRVGGETTEPASLYTSVGMRSGDVRCSRSQ